MKKTKKKTRSKKSNLPKILIGGAILGGLGYAVYEFWYKPMQTKKAADEAAAAAKQAAAAAAAGAAIGGNVTATAPVIDRVINNAQNAPKNEIPATTLSPIGTDPKKVNWAAKVKYGDKGGEVQVIQKLFNAIARILGSYTIDEDGIYGNDTLAKKRGNFGNVYTITPKQVYDKLQKVKAAAIVDAKQKEIIASLPSWMK